MKQVLAALLASICAVSPAGAADDLISRGQDAVVAKLTDPSSAQFRNVIVKTTDGRQVVCGWANAKNRMGDYDGPKPFLFDPAITRGAIIYGGGAITDDPLSRLVHPEGYRNVCGG